MNLLDTSMIADKSAGGATSDLTQALDQYAAALDDAPDGADGEGCHPLFRDVPSTVGFNKLRKRLLRQTRQAMDDFAMVRPGDRWLVALSGGKDSYGLMALLLDLKWRGLLPVELLACNLDQGQPNFPKHILPEYLTRNQIPHRIEYKDTYSIVTDKIPENQTYCALCSRLRVVVILSADGIDADQLGVTLLLEF